MTRRLYVANENQGPQPWSVGAAQYRVGHHADENKLIVAVHCRIDELGEEVYALLDTGAEWSMLGGKLARQVLDQADVLGAVTTMRTRLGRIRGNMQSLTITLFADDGSDHQVSSTIIVAPEWEGPFVLGYSGMIERIRVALDPGISETDQWIYFGAAG